jgi:hypothetical protein
MGRRGCGVSGFFLLVGGRGPGRTVQHVQGEAGGGTFDSWTNVSTFDAIENKQQRQALGQKETEQQRRWTVRHGVFWTLFPWVSGVFFFLVGFMAWTVSKEESIAPLRKWKLVLLAHLDTGESVEVNFETWGMLC